MAYQNPRAGDPLRRPGQLNEAAARSASFGSRVRSEDSWVELSSQPSSSSLSSIGDEIVTTGLRVQHDPRQQQQKRRRTLRPSAPSGLSISTTTQPSSSEGGISSQEEYEESESESDRVMTSSGEGGPLVDATPWTASEQAQHESLEDEDKTAINQPMRHNTNNTCFTPQPNAFTHPPSSGHIRNASHPPHTTESYFPASQPRPVSRPQTRQPSCPQHLPQNILSPSYNAAAQHEEALRASLSTLLSCAAAARGLPAKSNRTQQAEPSTRPQSRGGHRVEPMSFRLVPESALPVSSQQSQQQRQQQGFQEPTFHPTLRRTSTSTTNSAPLSPQHKESKRKIRPSSNEDRGRHPSPTSAAVSKKARRSSSASADPVSPTLLTWVVSAGVVVVLSALSFSAGYSMGREAGRWEVVEFRGGGVPGGGGCGDEVLRGCAREAGRSGLGLKRSLARSAVQV